MGIARQARHDQQGFHLLLRFPISCDSISILLQTLGVNSTSSGSRHATPLVRRRKFLEIFDQAAGIIPRSIMWPNLTIRNYCTIPLYGTRNAREAREANDLRQYLSTTAGRQTTHGTPTRCTHTVHPHPHPHSIPAL